MAQNITLKIAGHEFPLAVNSEESERTMRLAAEDVEKLLAKYSEKMPDRQLVDRMILVALGEAVGKLQNASRLAAVADEVGALKSEVAKYIDSVK